MGKLEHSKLAEAGTHEAGMRTLVLLATLSLALAAVHPRGSLPSGWAQSEVLQLSAKTDALTLTLFLNDNALGLELVKKHALEASNPRSLKYGQYLSIEEIARLTAPSDIAVEAVTQWLANSLPATAINQRASTLEITCSLAQAEALFSTQFGMLYNNNTRQAVVRAGDFTLPEHLEQHVAAVFGLHGLPLPPRRLSAPNGNPAVDAAAVTPDVLANSSLGTRSGWMTWCQSSLASPINCQVSLRPKHRS